MHQNGYIGRKMRLPKLEKNPALVLAAFGSGNRAGAALDLVREKVKAIFAGHEIFWAYTSEIIRRKMGLPSPQETLARVEARGFRKVVVQPLHIFPGTEYQQLAETCAYFPGLRVFLGETLLHRWDFVKQTLKVLEKEFLAPDEGLNLLALHGTPLAADPVNILYLGLERLVTDLYANVMVAGIEGVPDPEAVLTRIGRMDLGRRSRKIKIIPMMFLAGHHAEQDLMGKEGSWRRRLEDLGFAVECPQVVINGTPCFKGLVHYPQLIAFFMDRLERSLNLERYY